MNREDIEHLARLSRISFTEVELTRLQTDLSSIMEYVGAVSDMASDAEDSAPQVGARFNIMRPDEVTNAPDEYTEALLAEMPHTEGRYLAVKKILQTEE